MEGVGRKIWEWGGEGGNESWEEADYDDVNAWLGSGIGRMEQNLGLWERERLEEEGGNKKERERGEEENRKERERGSERAKWGGIGWDAVTIHHEGEGIEKIDMRGTKGKTGRRGRE